MFNGKTKRFCVDQLSVRGNTPIKKQQPCKCAFIISRSIICREPLHAIKARQRKMSRYHHAVFVLNHMCTTVHSDHLVTESK